MGRRSSKDMGRVAAGKEEGALPQTLSYVALQIKREDRSPRRE